MLNSDLEFFFFFFEGRIFIKPAVKIYRSMDYDAGCVCVWKVFVFPNQNEHNRRNPFYARAVRLFPGRKSLNLYTGEQRSCACADELFRSTVFYNNCLIRIMWAYYVRRWTVQFEFPPTKIKKKLYKSVGN